MTKKQKKMLIRIILCVILTVIIQLIPCSDVISRLLYIVPYLIIGGDVLVKAAKGILNGQVLDENFLMAVATIGAFVLGAMYTGDYIEAVAVMLFYQIGELFQSLALGKSRKSISSLMDLRPDYANVEKDGVSERISPEEVPVGAIITVSPGEKIPIDGVIVSGSSSVNTSSITGESLPRDVFEGDEVFSGCVNMTGLIKIKTTRLFEASTASKILDLVENASSRKSKSENFISAFARVYTPLVCILALFLAVVPPVVSYFVFENSNFVIWLYRALSFLVASCPCALVVSIPLTFFAGIGGAGAEGILIKGSSYLESLSKAKYVVFDKTGTLTEGKFEVSQVHSTNISREELLEYAALAEFSSSHPIALCLKQACQKKLDFSRVSDIKEYGGYGVIASIDDRLSVAVGNKKLMKKVGLEIECEDDGTIIHVATDGKYSGYIKVSDVIKPSAASTVKALGKLGIEKTIMLSGDCRSSVEKTAAAVGTDAYYGELLPDGKVEIVEKLLNEKPLGSTLIFVGDGINDAPVLSRADIGIAMGGMGSDAAIEAADIVLMDDNPEKIVRAVKISTKCRRIVRQNIVFSLIVKASILAFVAIGITGMWSAVFADVGVAIIAILNSIRAFHVKN